MKLALRARRRPFVLYPPSSRTPGVGTNGDEPAPFGRSPGFVVGVAGRGGGSESSCALGAAVEVMTEELVNHLVAERASRLRMKGPRPHGSGVAAGPPVFFLVPPTMRSVVVGAPGEAV